MRLLLISDLHANQEAFEAVMNAAPEHDLVANLGDVVGYNGSPNEVCERAIALGGTHRSRQSRPRLFRADGSQRLQSGGCHFCALDANHAESRAPAMAARLAQGPMRPEALPGIEFVHGAPEDEDEYLLNVYSAEESFRMPGQANVIFFGHTHLQGGFLETGGKIQQFVPDTTASRARWGLIWNCARELAT